MFLHLLSIMCTDGDELQMISSLVQLMLRHGLCFLFYLSHSTTHSTGCSLKLRSQNWYILQENATQDIDLINYGYMIIGFGKFNFKMIGVVF